MTIALQRVSPLRKLRRLAEGRNVPCHSDPAVAGEESRVISSNTVISPRDQRCFPSLNITANESPPQNSAKYFFPLHRRMSDTAAPSLTDAIWNCSPVCWYPHVYVAAEIARSAEKVDSISGPASGSSRFAKSAHRRQRCKSARAAAGSRFNKRKSAEAISSRCT